MRSHKKQRTVSGHLNPTLMPTFLKKVLAIKLEIKEFNTFSNLQDVIGEHSLKTFQSP